MIISISLLHHNSLGDEISQHIKWDGNKRLQEAKWNFWFDAAAALKSLKHLVKSKGRDQFMRRWKQDSTKVNGVSLGEFVGWRWFKWVWAVVIGRRRSSGGRVLIWEVQKRKETPGASPPLSLSLKLKKKKNCTVTNSPWEASECVHMWNSSAHVYF